MEGFPAWPVVPPLALFVALVVAHDRVIRSRERTSRTAEYFKQGIRRIDDAWTGLGNPGARFLDYSHPYAPDIDLFGPGSLFELLCTARTSGGEERLASWLRAPAPPDTVRARQAAVADLRDRLDLRLAMAIHGDEVRTGTDPAAIASWGSLPPARVSRLLPYVAGLIGAANIATAILWATGINRLEFYGMVAVTALFDSLVWPRIRAIVRSIDRVGHDLEMIAETLKLLEETQLDAPLLKEMIRSLEINGMRPSEQIVRLRSLVSYLDARRNMAFALFGALLLWTTQFSLAIERWRRRFGPRLEIWIEAISEVEALSALATYAFEHPDDPFPEIAEGALQFEVSGLTHPLLPASAAVRNDLRLDHQTRLIIISGSNMSGKSTLLRSIGVASVMALAGAPVRAASLKISPLSLGASIRIVDSLQTGTSRFYAEIKRLRQIVEIATERPPLLFLLDEILHGTNSHDRLIGAEAVVRALLAHGAFGLVTTHDLALTRILEDKSLHGINVHFQDELIDGEMKFDYRIRPGVVEHSNAIALMRAVGLDV